MAFVSQGQEKKHPRTCEEDEQKEIGKAQSRYRRESGDAAGAFMQFWRKTKEESAIPTKYKELMQLAIVLTMHCRPCINLHTQICLDVGCTRAEILDAANVALAMGGGPVFTYIGHLMQALDECQLEEAPKPHEGET
jgi:AhpD family alkylhydroperoxidase